MFKCLVKLAENDTLHESQWIAFSNILSALEACLCGGTACIKSAKAFSLIVNLLSEVTSRILDYLSSKNDDTARIHNLILTLTL
mmetsp:Transcript_3133/g.4293  ORF Transcript_3133/g.4293 Transcript_3133/m.4293 type:complete len:84 (-) Transcript_3133:159-410(-)